MRSSIETSSSEAASSVRRSSPKRSAISESSSMMRSRTLSSSPSSSRSSRMRSVTSACSCLIASDSSAVSCERRRSRIAVAWMTESPNWATRSLRADSRSGALRIRSMIASRLSSAMSRPSRTCARASFWASSNFARRTMTSRWCCDVGGDDLAQRERARHAVDERDHVHAERGLHRGVLVELVEHDLRDDAALELDDEPHAAPVGLVAQVGDLGDLLLVHEVGDLRDQPAVAALLHLRREAR